MIIDGFSSKQPWDARFLEESESTSDFSEIMLQKQKEDAIKTEGKDEQDPLKKLFTDPEKLMKLWLMGETKQNPFAEDQKDPMETMGKFIQSMLMQNQSNALVELKNTMVRNNKFSATSMIGKMVDVETDTFAIRPGKLLSETFVVPEEANAYHIVIKDNQNNTVFEDYRFDAQSGLTKFEWKGLDQDGKELASGEYSISVDFLNKAKNSEGKTTLKHVEFAKDLSGNIIENKRLVLSKADRDIQFSYEIPKSVENAKHANIWITNSRGTPVHKGSLDINPGDTGIYSWNCLDQAGKTIPEDDYTVYFNLKDMNHKNIQTSEKTKIKVASRVEGVELSDNPDPTLITSRIKAPLSTIKNIVNETGL